MDILFEHGIRRFGYFLGEVTLVLVVIIFAINVYLHRSVLESFLFSLALAVGLTPQLLPAIISINLAYGDAHLMVTKGALTNILDVCSSAETNKGSIVEISSMQDHIQKHFAEFSNQGFRTLSKILNTKGAAL